MSRIRSIVPQSVLAWLCHFANANPMGRKFYELKERLLRQYAEFRGHDIQEITKRCWGYEHPDGWLGCGQHCRKCGGTGIFDRRWIRLQRWQWGRYTFHIPDGTTWKNPDSIQIVGRIRHVNYGKLSREAELWLYVVTFQFRTLWYSLTAQSYCSPGWWPMCRLQKCAMWASMKLSWRKCWCGRRYPTWGTGWLVCGKCRNRKPTLDDIPF